MSLVTWKYTPRRRGGQSKSLEQSGDWPRLMEHLIKLSEAHFDFQTAAELRAQLRSESITQVITEPAYTEPITAIAETEPEKPRRRKHRKRKAKAPLPSSPDKKLRQAWREVDARRGRDV